jgi:hypothetical protein
VETTTPSGFFLKEGRIHTGKILREGWGDPSLLIFRQDLIAGSSSNLVENFFHRDSDPSWESFLDQSNLDYIFSTRL